MNRITVRGFLDEFGAARRGAVKVQAIREILEKHDLKTDPDFATAWIDEPIWLRLKDGFTPYQIDLDSPNAFDDDHGASTSEQAAGDGPPSVSEEAVERAEPASMSGEPNAAGERVGVETSDPTFRIGMLPAANRGVIRVDPNDSVTKAISLMLQNDFSQVPVMQGEREVRGMVSWKSIGSRLACNRRCDRIADYEDDARIVNAARTLFDVIPMIVEDGYVLVRQRDRRITGIVTASDLSLQFRALAEPFLLLREIELHVRRLIGGKLTREDLDLLGTAEALAHRPQNIADLTFGEYVRLFQRPETWGRLNLKIDCGVLTTTLEDVRKIRNDVMHFDPDPMTDDELRTLKQAVRFISELYQLHV